MLQSHDSVLDPDPQHLAKEELFRPILTEAASLGVIGQGLRAVWGALLSGNMWLAFSLACRRAPGLFPSLWGEAGILPLHMASSLCSCSWPGWPAQVEMHVGHSQDPILSLPRAPVNHSGVGWQLLFPPGQMNEKAVPISGSQAGSSSQVRTRSRTGSFVSFHFVFAG